MSMPTSSSFLPCDGCGLAASPAHIAGRIRRLELSTMFRPIHIGILFISLAPPARLEDYFYGPPESKDFFDPFLAALEIPYPAEKVVSGSDAGSADRARLAEFQRRGYFLAHLSECPIPHEENPAATISRLGQTLIRRIRFNYRPKHIAPLGKELAPLVEMLKGAGVGPVLTLEQGPALTIPAAGDQEGMSRFRRAVTGATTRENLSVGL